MMSKDWINDSREGCSELSSLGWAGVSCSAHMFSCAGHPVRLDPISDYQGSVFTHTEVSIGVSQTSLSRLMIISQVTSAIQFGSLESAGSLERFRVSHDPHWNIQLSIDYVWLHQISRLYHEGGSLYLGISSCFQPQGPSRAPLFLLAAYNCGYSLGVGGNGAGAP